MHFPLVGRLSLHEYSVLVFGSVFVLFEAVLRLVIFFLPKPIIDWFYDRSRSLFHCLSAHQLGSPEKKILHARDFEDICNIYGYTHEEHLCLTKDGYLLGTLRHNALWNFTAG